MKAVICVECGQKSPCPEGHTNVVDLAGSSMAWVQAFPVERQADIVTLMQEMIGVEATYTDMEADDIHWGYRPYPLGKFAKLMLVACKSFSQSMAHLRPLLSFLEVGCGPATKVLFAGQVFGVTSHGFDIEPPSVADGHELLKARGALGQCDVWREDAEDFGEYNEYDIIFLNRPLRDYDRQVQLEQMIYRQMRDGACLILGNALTTPPYWDLLMQDVACAVYKKTCRCKDIETFIQPVPINHAGEDIELECKLCGRLFPSLKS
jgi:hypothetical protein